LLQQAQRAHKARQLRTLALLVFFAWDFPPEIVFMRGQ
jgi:hypothetical protein